MAAHHCRLWWRWRLSLCEWLSWGYDCTHCCVSFNCCCGDFSATPSSFKSLGFLCPKAKKTSRFACWEKIQMLASSRGENKSFAYGGGSQELPSLFSATSTAAFHKYLAFQTQKEPVVMCMCRGWWEVCCVMCSMWSLTKTCGINIFVSRWWVWEGASSQYVAAFVDRSHLQCSCWCCSRQQVSWGPSCGCVKGMLFFCKVLLPDEFSSIVLA